MCGKFFFLCAAILFSIEPSAVGRRTDYCTSGFMSMDRMEAAVQGGSAAEDHIFGNEVLPFTLINGQVILPYINFTCDGSILSWSFGAQWEGNSPRYTELQIWRSSGDGSYTKVGSTTIMLEEENSTQLYQYTLTSPLPFQAGDILGFFQGTSSTSQLTLLYEDVGSAQPVHYVTQDSPSSQFIMNNSMSDDGLHMLINVQTDSAGCDCGFMSLERMHILLGLETVGNRSFTDQRQQITPDITFTCDGYITKWMVGANWADSPSLYPELQVWRNVGNDEYQKINGTIINITSQSPTHIYEYDNFSPIPVLAGDILGVFLPQTQCSKLRLWSEVDSGPVVYYVYTGSATESPNYLQLSSTRYFPAVTVEISVSSSTSSASTTPPPHTTGEDGNAIDNVSLFVGVGVAVTLLVLITAAVIIITVWVCLKKKTNKLKTADNMAYLSSTSEVKLSPNAAYTAIGDHNPTSHDHEYMYMTTTYEAISQEANTTTSTETCNIKASDTTAVANEAMSIPTSTNSAYAISTSANAAYGLPTSTDGELKYEVTMSTNQAYDIPTSTNQAYEATQYQDEIDALTYDYVI